jgi:uncharacterized protein
MALYAFRGLDKPDGLDLRKATRSAHLEWIDGFSARVKLAGPLLSADGGALIGSLIVLEADSLADATALFAADPYAKAGLWAHTDLTPFTQVRP